MSSNILHIPKGRNKTMREKKRIYKGTLIELSADFYAETLQGRREWNAIFKVLKGKKPAT